MDLRGSFGRILRGRMVRGLLVMIPMNIKYNLDGLEIAIEIASGLGS